MGNIYGNILKFACKSHFHQWVEISLSISFRLYARPHPHLYKWSLIFLVHTSVDEFRIETFAVVPYLPAARFKWRCTICFCVFAHNQYITQKWFWRNTMQCLCNRFTAQQVLKPVDVVAFRSLHLMFDVLCSLWICSDSTVVILILVSNTLNLGLDIMHS